MRTRALRVPSRGGGHGARVRRDAARKTCLLPKWCTRPGPASASAPGPASVPKPDSARMRGFRFELPKTRARSLRARVESGMPKRTRGADADADTPVSEDTLKAAYKLFCRAYVSVSGEDVPACDQLKHHALWVRSRPATRLALLATRTRRDSTRCAFRSCAPAGGGPQDPLRTLRHSDCEHAWTKECPSTAI